MLGKKILLGRLGFEGLPTIVVSKVFSSYQNHSPPPPPAPGGDTIPVENAKVEFLTF